MMSKDFCGRGAQGWEQRAASQHVQAKNRRPPWVSRHAQPKTEGELHKTCKVQSRTSAHRVCQGYSYGWLPADICCSPAQPPPFSSCFLYIIAKYVCQIEKDKIGRWKDFVFPPARGWQILCHNTLTESGGCFYLFIYLFYWCWLQDVSVALKDCINFVIQVESPLLLLIPGFERFIS